MAFYVLDAVPLEVYQVFGFFGLFALSLFEMYFFGDYAFFACRTAIFASLELCFFVFVTLISLRLYAQVFGAPPLPIKCLLVVALILLAYDMVVFECGSDHFDLELAVGLDGGAAGLPVLFGFYSRATVEFGDRRALGCEWVQHELQIEVYLIQI